MITRSVLLLAVVLALSGCATTTTFTLASGDTIQAAKIVEETPSTYVIEEQQTGRRTAIPKGAVVSISGQRK
jgi:uncharacterized protein YceK